MRDASHTEQFMSKIFKLHFKFSSIITQLSWFVWCCYSSLIFAINSFVKKLLSRGHFLKRKQRVNPGVSPNPTPWCLLEWVLECHIPLSAAALSVLTLLAKTRWALVQWRPGTNVSYNESYHRYQPLSCFLTSVNYGVMLPLSYLLSTPLHSIAWSNVDDLQNILL